MALASPIQVTNFRELERWDVKYFTGRIVSKYPLVPLSEIVYEHNEKIRPSEYPDQSFKILGVNNTSGIFHAYDTLGKKIKQPYKKVSAGDFAYNPYRINVGSIGLVPDEHNGGYISPAYVVFKIDETKILPEIFWFILKSGFFNKALRAATAGSVRMNLTYPLLLNLKIPIAPFKAQAKILEYYRDAKDKSSELLLDAERKKKEIEEFLYSSLGVPFPNNTNKKRKIFKAQWQDVTRWSYEFISNTFLGVSGFSKSKYPLKKLGGFIEKSMNGYCIRPANRRSEYYMLKLSGLTNSGLNPNEIKPIIVDSAIAGKYHLRENDLLVCRSNAYDYVGKSVVIESEYEDILYPDTIIKVLLNASVDTKYVNIVMESGRGRRYFQTNSRRAVGGMWKISSKDIKSFILPIPPMSVQIKIVKEISNKWSEYLVLQEKTYELLKSAEQSISQMILGFHSINGV